MDASKTISSSIVTAKDVTTFVHCTSFFDRHVVGIAQLSKFGTWIEGWCEESADGNVLFQTKVLLGKRDDPILHIYARQIIEKIVSSSTSRKPLLLSISLQPDSHDAITMQDILNKVFEINTWQ